VSLRTAVFASGRGSNFQVLVDAARGGKKSGAGPPGVAQPASTWEVVLLVTDRMGAGVLDRARDLSVPSATVPPDDPPHTFADRLLYSLEEARVEMVLLAGYLRLVPPDVVRRYRGRMLNLHPALLPGFGGSGMYGRRVHQAVLDSGARISGATVHFVDEEYDRGPILAQWPVPVHPADTPETLQGRIQEVEHILYPAAVNALAESLASGAVPVPIPSTEAYFHTSSLPPDIP
jgi:phosphoribosylglycinamide formyltransferase 1